MKIVPFPLNPQLSLSISVTDKKERKNTAHTQENTTTASGLLVISCQKLVIQVVQASEPCVLTGWCFPVKVQLLLCAANTSRRGKSALETDHRRAGLLRFFLSTFRLPSQVKSLRFSPSRKLSFSSDVFRSRSASDVIVRMIKLTLTDWGAN